MVAYFATIQLLIQLQEEIGVLLYSGEEDQLTKPFHLLPEFEWTVAKSATVATIQRMVAKMNGSTLPQRLTTNRSNGSKFCYHWGWMVAKMNGSTLPNA